MLSRDDIHVCGLTQSSGCPSNVYWCFLGAANSGVKGPHNSSRQPFHQGIAQPHAAPQPTTSRCKIPLNMGLDTRGFIGRMGSI
ncbi:hypothetical protein JTE90_014638 [Oedothorax gibbosus]|uniref:Uncharacterized protein n=1 Tax=Oedothorax gibbosus TaxID=931172 RepID=A0AAV6V8P1_9ARAC|nr:hypothetical protein JTE90_014638 [Oedothorax gibbosus]